MHAGTQLNGEDRFSLWEMLCCCSKGYSSSVCFSCTRHGVSNKAGSVLARKQVLQSHSSASHALCVKDPLVACKHN